MSEKNIEEIIGKDFDEKSIEYRTESARVYKDFPDLITKAIDDKSQGSKWSVNGSIWTAAPGVANELTPGVYDPIETMQGTFLVKKDVNTDSLLKLPDDPTGEVLDHVQDFWDRKDRFDRLNLIFKRGILLWGPQGSGKTSTMFQLMNQIVRQEGIVLLCDYPGDLAKGLRMLRSVELDRRIIVVMEDIDSIIMRYGDRMLTSILDGDENVTNVCFVATTNYPERLPPRLLNRPSRFDVVKFIGMPTEKAREAYIKHVLKRDVSVSEAKEWARATEDMSIAQIKETIILVKVFDLNLEEAIDRVRNLGKISNPQLEVSMMNYKE